MLIKEHTLTEHTDLLANMLPNDFLFLAKNLDETNLRKLLSANAKYLRILENYIIETIDEYDPTTTNKFLSEWESALGLPNECISIASDAQTRRDNILLVLNSLGVQTEKDFIDLAAKLGFLIEIFHPIENTSFPYTLPFVFTDSLMSARFTVEIRAEASKQPNVFPFAFPITFTNSEIANILECLFKKLVPSFVRVVFSYVL